MVLQEVLEKMRHADKVTVLDGTKQMFCGNVNKCLFLKDLIPREVDDFYPELLGGLIVNLKTEKKDGGKEFTAGKDIHEKD